MKEFMPHSAAKMADCLMKRYGLLTSRWSYDYGVAWRGTNHGNAQGGLSTAAASETCQGAVRARRGGVPRARRESAWSTST